VNRAGVVVLGLAALAVAAGLVLDRVDRGPDANIGAGLLVLSGIPLAVLGIVLVVVGALRGRSRQR
jgi:hypothetical protein